MEFPKEDWLDCITAKFDEQIKRPIVYAREFLDSDRCLANFPEIVLDLGEKH